MIHLLRSYISYFFTCKPYQGNSFKTFPGSILLFKPFGKFIKFHPQGCLLGQITYKRWVRKDVPLTRLLWRIMWNRKLAEKCTKEKTKKDLKIFKEFLHCKEKLDIYLDNFIRFVWQKDGEDYKPSCLVLRIKRYFHNFLLADGSVALFLSARQFV